LDSDDAQSSRPPFPPKNTALQLGATKTDFDDMVGIHPTDAEAFASLAVTKSSGVRGLACFGFDMHSGVGWFSPPPFFIGSY